jgi:hypothetical protein
MHWLRRIRSHFGYMLIPEASRPRFRDDATHHSEMISPTVPTWASMPAVFIFMSSCGGMMLMLVGRPLYLCNSYTTIPHGRPHRFVKARHHPFRPARFVRLL